MLIHDLRNPLATVHGYTQLLRRRAAGRDLAVVGLDEGLRHIQDAVARLERLVDQLAESPAKARTQREAFPARQTDFVQLAQRMAAETQPTPGELGRVAILSAVPDLLGDWDPTGLERVLGNLLDNALKYSPADRPVVVMLRREGEWALISVADKGVGIPPAELAKVFTRGYRASNAAGTGPGTGIGLAAVRCIVNAIGGRISIDSQLDVGTTVTVRLPVCAQRQPSSRLRSRRWCSGS